MIGVVKVVILLLGECSVEFLGYMVVINSVIFVIIV